MTSQNKYIFVSYACANSDKVFHIVNDLTENGFNLWIDKDIRIGTEWPMHIEEKIRNCYCLMVFISKNAVNSVNVRNEINFAITQNKKFFIIFLEDTELKYGLGLQIGNMQSLLAYKHSSYEGLLKEIMSSELLRCCKEVMSEESFCSNAFEPSSKCSLLNALDSFQNALMKLKGNASSDVLAAVLSEEDRLKELISNIQDSSRSQYFAHLSKIDLFLNALKIQFSFSPIQTNPFQLMFIDTYLTQIIPEIELMRQI